MSSSFLQDAEQVDALISYLKALSKIPMAEIPTNVSVLNIWISAPLSLAGLVPEKPVKG